MPGPTYNPDDHPAVAAREQARILRDQMYPISSHIVVLHGRRVAESTDAYDDEIADYEKRKAELQKLIDKAAKAEGA